MPHRVPGRRTQRPQLWGWAHCSPRTSSSTCADAHVRLWQLEWKEDEERQSTVEKEGSCDHRFSRRDRIRWPIRISAFAKRVLSSQRGMMRFQKTEIISSVTSAFQPSPTILKTVPSISFLNQTSDWCDFSTLKPLATIQYMNFKSLNTAKGLFTLWSQTVPGSKTFSLRCPRQASYRQAVHPLKSMRRGKKVFVLWLSQNAPLTHDESAQAQLKCQVLSFWLQLHHL